MAALCLDASLETLWPLCSHCTLRLLGDPWLSRVLWRFQHAMFSQTAHSLLSRGLGSALPESQFSAPMKARRFLCSHSWVVLAFWAGTESCWKTCSWPLKRVMVRCFKLLVARPLDALGHQFSPLSCKNEDVSPPDETLPAKPWRRKGDGLPAPSGYFPSIKLVFLTVVLLLDGEDFLVCEEDVFLPFLGVPLEETPCSCPLDCLQSRSKDVSLWAAVPSHVERPWWGTTLIG